MPPAGLETAVAESEQPQSRALDSAAIEIGKLNVVSVIKFDTKCSADFTMLGSVKIGAYEIFATKLKNNKHDTKFSIFFFRGILSSSMGLRQYLTL